MAEVETLGAAAIATLVLGSGGVIGFFRLLNEMRAQNRMEREQRRSEFDGIRNEMRLDRQEARAGRQEERTQYTTFFGTYDRSIATLKIQYDSETDAARKTAFKEQLDKMADEYHIQLEAYRQTSNLRQEALQGAVPSEQPPPPEARRTELSERLKKSEPLSPTLLTAEDYLARGNASYELQLYGAAFTYYNRSLELRPDDPVTLRNRAITLRHLQRYDEALVDYNRSLELRPDDPGTLNNRAITLRYLERYNEALVNYNHSLELGPDNPGTLSNRGNLFIILHRLDDALADVNRALELKPGHPLALYNRACVYSRSGRFKESLKDLKEAISRDEKYRKMAREDEDFDNLRSDPEFERLVAEPEK